MPRFAAVQMESRLNDPTQNLRMILDKLEEAAKLDAQVVVFPECSLTGYALTAEEADAISEGIPGPRTKAIQEACANLDVIAVVGTLEKDSQGACFNSAVLMDRSGLLGVYRKTHLPFLGVDRYLAGGDRILEPVKTHVGALGMLICYDLRFPEPARVLALLGAQVILLPTAWPEKATIYRDFIGQARAEENRVFLVAANHAGQERGTRYLGNSLIISPGGEILAQADEKEETILTADFEPTQSEQKRIVFAQGEYELDLFGDRRPELYTKLVLEKSAKEA